MSTAELISVMLGSVRYPPLYPVENALLSTNTSKAHDEFKRTKSTNSPSL